MKALIVIAVAYALGCFSTAYYLFRFITGRDIRRHGSGNAGARNIGAELGALAFAVTFLIDGAKGLLAVGLARYFELPDLSVMVAMVAVVAGHIWPAPLSFRGGKGVATGIGALAAFDYRLLIPLIFVTGVGTVLSRNFTLGGLAAMLLTPIAAAMLRHSHGETAGVAVLATLIIFAHRQNLREIFAATPAGSGKTFDPQVDRRHP